MASGYSNCGTAVIGQRVPPASEPSDAARSVSQRVANQGHQAEQYFSADGERFQAPASYRLQTRTANGWQQTPLQWRSPKRPLANGENRIESPAVSTEEPRIEFANPAAPARFRLIGIEAFLSEGDSETVQAPGFVSGLRSMAR